MAPAPSSSSVSVLSFLPVYNFRRSRKSMIGVDGDLPRQRRPPLEHRLRLAVPVQRHRHAVVSFGQCGVPAHANGRNRLHGGSGHQPRTARSCRPSSVIAPPPLVAPSPLVAPPPLVPLVPPVRLVVSLPILTPPPPIRRCLGLSSRHRMSSRPSRPSRPAGCHVTSLLTPTHPICRRLHLSSRRRLSWLHPPLSVNIHPTRLLVHTPHSQPETFVCPLLRSQLLVLWRE